MEATYKKYPASNLAKVSKSEIRHQELTIAQVPTTAVSPELLKGS
jgi:hypothetical protein